MKNYLTPAAINRLVKRLNQPQLVEFWKCGLGHLHRNYAQALVCHAVTDRALFIAEHHAAGYTDKQIAKLGGIPLEIVENEIKKFSKRHDNHPLACNKLDEFRWIYFDLVTDTTGEKR